MICSSVYRFAFMVCSHVGGLYSDSVPTGSVTSVVYCRISPDQTLRIAESGPTIRQGCTPSRDCACRCVYGDGRVTKTAHDKMFRSERSPPTATSILK